MLGIRRIGADRADYYLSDLAAEVPVSPGARAAWAGTAAAAFGLHGAVEARSFGALLEGRHPRTGYRMGAARTVAAYDLTFSAPKSASVLFALGDPVAAATIVAAHRTAVAGAVTYVEQHALAVDRRAGGERHVLPTDGLVAGAFTHAVNRNLDPHLHTHVVVANLVHASDGRWSACDQRGLVAHRQAASCVYDAVLRATLTDSLGVRWSQAPGVPAEIEGISPAVRAEFSTRTSDIRRRVHESGARSGWGRQVARAATRPAKPAAVSFEVLAAEWRRRAGAVEADPVAAAVRRGRAGVLDEHCLGAVLSCTPHGGAFRRDAVAAFSTAARDGVRSAALERIVDLWVPASTAVGVAEPLQARRTLVPAPHLLDTLGPRPIDPAAHEVWRDAARAVQRYRARWDVTAPDRALGSDLDLSRHTERLIDHARTVRQLQEARARLGVREPPQVEIGRGR